MGLTDKTIYSRISCIVISLPVLKRPMKTVFSVLQIILSVLMIVVVLLQQKGSGLGSAFGGASTVYTTRRGVDKLLFNATIVISVLFLVISLVAVLV